LAIASKLLSQIPIPEKLLNRPRPNTNTNTSAPKASSVPVSYNPYSIPSPYGLNPLMYQYPQSAAYGAVPGQEGTSLSQTTLYCRNLPQNQTEEEVLSVFQQYGTIRESRFQRNKDTGKFSGAVFVEYVHPSAAKLAHIQLNQKMWGDRTVHIDFAKERVQSTGEKPQAQPSNSIYICNLPPETDKTLLMDLFSRFGTILDARPLKTNQGNDKGIAFVDFMLQVSAAAAIDALDNTLQHGRMIRVSFAANPSKRKGEELAADATKRFRSDVPASYPTMPVYYDPTTQMTYQAPEQWYGQTFY